MVAVIEVEELRKRYRRLRGGTTVALDGRGAPVTNPTISSQLNDTARVCQPRVHGRAPAGQQFVLLVMVVLP